VIALNDSSEQKMAVTQAKKIIRLNPHNNLGVSVRYVVLCPWFLEARDTEGCTNLLRKYGTNGDLHLAYTPNGCAPAIFAL